MSKDFSRPRCKCYAKDGVALLKQYIGEFQETTTLKKRITALERMAAELERLIQQHEREAVEYRKEMWELVKRDHLQSEIPLMVFTNPPRIKQKNKKKRKV